MFQYPTKFVRPTAGFGYYSPFGVRSMHYGMDISNAQTDFTIYACNGGEVVYSAYDSAGGNMVIVHDKVAGELSRYAHLQSRAVQKGDIVSRGQAIGIMGNTGSNTTYKHLHFETWLVPQNYIYKYGDRTKYAVDPISVCHLLADQTWDANGKTTFKPIPYPEPKVEAELITGVLKVLKGGVRLRFIPETANYSYLVKGVGRGDTVLSDFLSEREFVATHRCVHDGYTWALIRTMIGSFWVAVLDGTTQLVAEYKPSEDVSDAPQTEDASQLKKELEASQTALRQLTELVKQDTATIQLLQGKLNAIAEIVKQE